jgi:hypothetical protein
MSADQFVEAAFRSSIGQISLVAFEVRHCNQTAADQQAA